MDDATNNVIEVTSPEAAQGKSTVVANLAVAFSRIGIPTIVLDADLRRPRQHEIFGLDNSSGLSNMLALRPQGRAQARRPRPLGHHQRPRAAGPDGDAPHPPAQRDQGAAAAQGAGPGRHAAGAPGQRRAPRGAARRRRHPRRHRGHAEARELPGGASTGSRSSTRACSAWCSTRPARTTSTPARYYRYEATGETAERLGTEPPARCRSPRRRGRRPRRHASGPRAARARPRHRWSRCRWSGGCSTAASRSWRRRPWPYRSASSPGSSRCTRSRASACSCSSSSP